MTQTFGTNAENDIYIGANGNLVVLQGEAAVEGACATASKASLGEEVLATTSGVPFFQAAFTGVPNLQAFNNGLLQALKQVDGVVAVSKLTSSIGKDADGRNALNYSATIESQYGITFIVTQENLTP